MSKVYVVQVPAFRGEGGEWVEKYDLSAAERFGELIRVLPYGNVPSDTGPTRAALLRAMRQFDYGSDYLLLLGDPVASAMAVRLLTQAQAGGPLRLLKWDRRDSSYMPFSVG